VSEHGVADELTPPDLDDLSADPIREPEADDQPEVDEPEIDELAPIEDQPPASDEPEPGPEPEPEPATDSEPQPATESEGEPGEEDGLELEPDLPALADDEALIPALEALLLVVDAPATEDSLAGAVDVPVARVSALLPRMSADYTAHGRGIDLRKTGEGWRFFTRDRYAPFVEKLLLDGQRARLTRAALETLAVIAYRQPVTRARIAAVRGVNVDGVIRTLVLRGLIEEIGTDAETGGLLYRTTELFLERLGLSSLEELPPIAPLLPEVDAIEDV
jgi:segregation and condensation protein B